MGFTPTIYFDFNGFSGIQELGFDFAWSQAGVPAVSDFVEFVVEDSDGRFTFGGWSLGDTFTGFGGGTGYEDRISLDASMFTGEDNGEDFVDILRFFYGADIEIIQAKGKCVLPVDPPGDTGGPGDDGPRGTDDDGASASADDGNAADAGDAGDVDGTAGDDDGVVDGTADDGTAAGLGTAADQGALPGTFGDDSEGGACACKSRGGGGGLVWLLGLVGLLRIRRRRP